MSTFTFNTNTNTNNTKENNMNNATSIVSIAKALSNQPELLNAFLKIAEAANRNAEGETKDLYIICHPMTTVSGEVHYHPYVMENKLMGYDCNKLYYTTNLIEAQKLSRLSNSVILNISTETLYKLQQLLDDFVDTMIETVDEATTASVNVRKLISTEIDTKALYQHILMDLMEASRYCSGAALDKNGKIVSETNVEMYVDETAEEDETDEEEWDEENEEEEEEYIW